ncbi:hypothetical protein J8F10_05835 [Gemmata sp. G18]|uniref:Uncharacterized protein n=1 Tax=Gemmata palustris TaxID=2822762 RepID=A0ABS5BM84_9BACT|nr:hypothetical protein [Gemmata palustris]MBP3954801.1 hypothetical protein [Gemmata palustris]
MTDPMYRYVFDPSVPAEELEATLVLSRLAVESLHGESQTRLDAAHAFEARTRTVVIDASTAVGRDFNRLFVGFTAREFGPASFRVERDPLEPVPHPPSETATA